MNPSFPATVPETPSVAGTTRPSWSMIVGAVLLIGLFYPSGQQLIRVWSMDANYSHGFLILPLSVFLAWRIVRVHPIPDQAETGLGLFTLGVGLGFHLLNVVLRFLPLEFLALILILRGLAVMTGGRAWADRFLFPTIFLVFMFPLPAALLTRMSIALQEVVAALSTEVFSWFFLSFRRGNNIHLAGVADPMFVAQECSGVRQLIAFIALGSLIAYLGKLGMFRGLLLVILAVPVAILANVFRVVLMGFGLRFFGPGWFFTWMHDLPALFTLPLGILLFLGLAKLISPGANRAEARS